jgi:transposase-like protein
MDGKYVKVKGFEQKIPFIYGIDYLTHDIPYGGLFVAEDTIAFSLFFERLRHTNYHLRMVVADDRAGLENGLNKAFPLRPLQLCHTHYLENIRRTLNIKSTDRYQDFFEHTGLQDSSLRIRSN